MISRKLIAALVGLTLATGAVTDVSAATTASGALATKPVAVQTTAKVPPKVTSKTTLGSKHVRKLSIKHRSARMTRHAVKRMKVARISKTSKVFKISKVTGGRKLRLSHSIKHTPSKHV